MKLLTQSECAREFNVSKQYIHKLIKDKRIVSYGEKKQVDYYEVYEYIHKNESYNNIDTNNIIEEDELRAALLKDLKNTKIYKIKNISEDELTDFIIENIYPFLDANFNFNEKIIRLSVIQTYIYYYQHFYETKPCNYTSLKKQLENKINYAKKRHNDLFVVINSFDYIPEGRIDKTHLEEVIKIMTAPNKSRLLSKSKLKKYDYKIDKILKQLPF